MGMREKNKANSKQNEERAAYWRFTARRGCRKWLQRRWVSGIWEDERWEEGKRDTTNGSEHRGLLASIWLEPLPTSRKLNFIKTRRKESVNPSKEHRRQVSEETIKAKGSESNSKHHLQSKYRKKYYYWIWGKLLEVWWRSITIGKEKIKLGRLCK